MMFIRILSILGAIVLLPLVGAPATAQAADCPNPFWGIYCPEGVYLSTDFGPVARATQVSGDGRARYGNFSPLTGEFSPITDWMPIHSEQWYNVEVVEAGRLLDFRGYASVETAFGPAVWGTELDSFPFVGRIGRWGIYNLLTATFYPDDAGWFPVGP